MHFIWALSFDLFDKFRPVNGYATACITSAAREGTRNPVRHMKVACL
jgi:hypothetical protein